MTMQLNLYFYSTKYRFDSIKNSSKFLVSKKMKNKKIN
ncbi:hypothetical Protein YC6258_00536 [Gynuella sunshinyii YC6258]|uniref:Uncharacterized protein n=1 Tax=Gynuella sunshinyii YC6258 TaxID=1445510 RepID=A0A0C5VEE3_9GAMM|nr:hypothetical Protein YC6258_00536 [Gynuella sunshinyii YC6258]